MSPQCGLSQGHLPWRTFPIWNNFKPTTRTDQHNQTLTYRSHLLSIPSQYCPGETIEILCFCLFVESTKTKVLDNKTSSCPVVISNKTKLNCSYVVTLTVTMMIFTPPAVDQAFCPHQTLIPGQHFVKDTSARLCYLWLAAMKIKVWNSEMD